MIVLSQLNVLLEVPQHIRNGLADGSLTSWGGTIRDAQGRIRALLVEGRGFGELVRQGAPLDPKLLTDAIGHAQTAAEVASGLAALNLGVNIAGFAMILQKLEALAEQLNHVLVGLSEVKEEARWIKSVQMAQLRADVESACDMALRAHRTHDLLLFKDARGNAHRARRALHHTMAIMLETERTIARHAIFAEFAQATAVLAVVEARCDEAVEGAGQAAITMSRAAEDLRRLTGKFDGQVRDFRVGLEDRLKGGDQLRLLLKSMNSDMHAVVRQMEGAAGRLSLQEALGLSSDQWTNWSAPEGSRLITCIAAGEDNEMDLIQVARLKLN